MGRVPCPPPGRAQRPGTRPPRAEKFRNSMKCSARATARTCGVEHGDRRARRPLSNECLIRRYRSRCHGSDPTVTDRVPRSHRGTPSHQNSMIFAEYGTDAHRIEHEALYQGREEPRPPDEEPRRGYAKRCHRMTESMREAILKISQQGRVRSRSGVHGRVGNRSVRRSMQEVRVCG